MIRFLVLVSFISGLKECVATRDIRDVSNVTVTNFPRTVVEGNDVEFTCHYDLEAGHPLYALKWYKGQEEFFRFVPGEKPPTKIFAYNKDINVVDISASSVNKVKLLNVTKGASGRYTCQILTEGPSFRNFEGHKILVVKQHKKLNNSDIYTNIPTIVKSSDTGTISCSYSPTKNKSSLKSTTWTKNGILFYKYEPDTAFNIALQKLPGINFSVKQTSNLTEITIHRVTGDTEGEYTCQVDYGTATFTSSGILLVKEDISKPVTVTVPELVNKGENVKLKCQYNPNGVDIASVKWFKGNREFYSYIPGEETVITSFGGVEIQDLITDDDYRNVVSTILLKQVKYDTAGSYRCVVSEVGGPQQSDSGILSVFRPPQGEPTVFVENDYLREGDYIRAECASPPSYPYANVSWYLNGREVYGQVINKDSNEHRSIGFPFPTTSKLSHRAEFRYQNTANLTCVVTISNAYRLEKTVKIEKDESFGYKFDNIHEQLAMSSGFNFLALPTHIITIVTSLLLLNW